MMIHRPQQMLEGIEGMDEDPYDEEGLEAALYGDMTRVLLEKQTKRKNLSRRLQEEYKQRNRQAQLQSEQAGR